MKTLYIERSTGECRDGKWVEALDLDGVERIVVGTGPGSFAGIRSALAFAQGFALGTKCEVLGLPSACACAAQVLQSIIHSNNSNNQAIRLAVVGDARQGKAWIALFDGLKLERDVFQVNQAELKGTVPSDHKVNQTDLKGSVPADYLVTTPDEKRLDGFLRDAFGDRYLGGQSPTSAGLQAFAEACPSILKEEPLPIYLNPAVR